jgi:hypothetical protein
MSPPSEIRATVEKSGAPYTLISTNSPGNIGLSVSPKIPPDPAAPPASDAGTAEEDGVGICAWHTAAAIKDIKIARETAATRLERLEGRHRLKAHFPWMQAMGPCLPHRYSAGP